MSPKRLNLGCGRNSREGWVNLDIVPLPGVDVVWDVNRLPLPFADGEFSEIRCDNILEHVEYIPLLKDLHRILQPGGTIHIRVPHFTSPNNFSDPTHRKMFSVRTFDFFVEGHENHYSFDFSFSGMTRKEIRFLKKGIFWGNRLLEPLVNAWPGMQVFYERSGLSRLFPANDVVVDLVK